jgi:hypothetical protein
MRRWLLLLICAALPPQGIAAVRAAAQSPCPMQTQMLEQQASAAMPDADLPDCCNDAETFARTGQPCKPMADVQLPSVAMLPLRAVPGSVAPQARPAAPRAVAPPDDPAATPWRPPAAV